MFHSKKLRPSFHRLKSIKYSNQQLTPENWCKEQPCITLNIVHREIILTQPTSTFFVYLLGLLTIGVGGFFLWNKGSEVSRLWWGVSLLLWGIGAILAGTSYQAFAYQIKCAGRQSCSWTSWWEVVYLIFQQLSVNALLVAVSYSSTTGSLQTMLLSYALINSIAYSIITIIGGLLAIKSLITFELMVWVSTPVFLLLLILTGWRYYLFSTPMDLALLGSWLLLLFTSAAYCLYEHFTITERLWKRGTGIWFSENDVLHIGLILWMMYNATVVASLIQDYTPSIVSA
jgi:hypothetical protein